MFQTTNQVVHHMVSPPENSLKMGEFTMFTKRMHGVHQEM
jgi:hypothetical protein